MRKLQLNFGHTKLVESFQAVDQPEQPDTASAVRQMEYNGVTKPLLPYSDRLCWRQYINPTLPPFTLIAFLETPKYNVFLQSTHESAYNLDQPYM